MSAMAAELRHALRALRARPAFALAAILTLALGIGANSAIFSLVEALLVRPLPYHDPGSLVEATNYVRDFNAEMATGGDYLDWKEQSRLLSAVEAFDDMASLTLTGTASIEIDYEKAPSHPGHARMIAVGSHRRMTTLLEELQQRSLHERRAMKKQFI